jgi:uncharacterized repeat protein (TIGR03803 family)
MLRQCALLAGLLGACLARGDSGAEAVLHSFEAGAIDGAYPYSSLLLASDGNFYGTTYGGGTHNAGAVFKLTPGGSISTLYDFGGNSSDGNSPRAGLVQGGDGFFYGTTQSGGAHAGGTVFQLKADGTFKTLYAFGASSGDGISPNAALIQGRDGNLYGTTQGGGAKGGGTVYKITTGGTLTILYSFGVNSTDGVIPSVGLVEGNDGNFYGTTEQGGANGKGTLFRVSPAEVLTTLYDFGASASDGATPKAGLIQAADGNFYGTTEAGGSNGNGTVFEMIPGNAPVTVNILHSFSGAAAEGALPRGGLYIGSDGRLYGTTQIGGAANLGTVYVLATDGSAFGVLHSFGGSNADGANPQVALVQGADGSYYGTALNGGPHNTGTVFKITADGSLSTLHTFGGQAPANGLNPAGELVLAADGKLYGTTSAGGSNTVGTVFSVRTDGSGLTTLHTFGSSPSDGANAAAGLVRGADGNFYGTTLNGGSNGYGTVYSITPDGSLSTLHSFGNFTGADQANDGFNPEGRLVPGSDGNFYGTTLTGGSKFQGTIFRVTPGGVFTSLYSLGTAASDGSQPSAGLVDGKNGNFYGTTYSGGAGGSGTVFSVSPSGGFTTLYSFGVAGAAASDGANPQAALLLAADGNLYGTTRLGGSNGKGTVFQISSGGNYKTLYSFGSASDDGANPQAALVQGSDGNLYGTTSSRGAFGKGTAFSISSAGVLTTLYGFGSSAGDGSGPVAGLAAGPGLVFYGSTYSGGGNGTGTLYRLAVTPSSSGGGHGGAVLPPALLVLGVAALRRRRLRRI